MFRKSLFGIAILLFAIILIGCPGFFSDGVVVETVEISSLELEKENFSLKVGEMTNLTLEVKPSSAQGKVDIDWDYDASIISINAQGSNVIVTGLKEGQTSLVAKYGVYSSVCIITVAGFTDTYIAENPYIYSNTSILQLAPNSQERFFVSLAGGSAHDINDFQWSIDNPTVASIHTTGQYCDITALQKGYARITVTHSKAPSFPYHIGVYVFDDIEDSTFITTQDNIVTLYKDSGEKSISVNLVNAPIEDYSKDFSWEVIENPESIKIVTNGDSAVISPLKAGVSTIRVTHPIATGGYPLDIVVRVIEIVENVYIEPSETIVTVTGEEEKTITVELEGLKNGENYSIDDFVFTIENGEAISHHSFSNQIFIKGEKNGSSNIYVSHPMALNSRQILVISEGQIEDAVDTSNYITTTQNYVKTKVGSEESIVNIALKGGTDGDEKDFHWEIKQSPDDGSSDVIKLRTTHGTTTSVRSISTLSSGFATGTAYIEPLSEGTATIILSHPKAYYKTEILVKVLDKDAVLEEPYWFSQGSSIVQFLNSEEYDYSITLNGSAVSTSDENNIEWSIDNSNITLTANGENAILSSNTTGTTISNMTIAHPRVTGEKKVVVLTADTKEELLNIKAFYADKTYFSVNKGDLAYLYVNSIGFGSYDTNSGDYIPEDFSAIKWTSSDTSVATVEKGTDPLQGVVTALSSGVAKITASYNNQASISFEITVYPEDVDIGEVEKLIYLTTSSNVVVMDSPTNKNISVSAIGLSTSEYNNITWKSNDSSIATVIENGTKAVISGVKTGETTLSVSHPLSENTLTIHVRIGDRYIIDTDPVVYISSSHEVVTLTKDDPAIKVTNILANSNVNSGFTYSIDNTAIADIQAQYSTGTCFIRPVNAGIAELTISNASAVSDKKILIIVGNTEEELSAFKYLSTSQNTVTIAQGSTKTLNVSVKNTDDVFLSGYSWISQTPSVASITATTASTAVVSGNEIGTTKLVIEHQDCDYPLEIIVQVVDPLSIFESPYITTSASILNLAVSSNWTRVSADLVGGKEEDYKDMMWSSTDPLIIDVQGQNNEADIKAHKAGMAYIEVYHPKANYEQKILVIAEDVTQSNCTIGVTENLISIKPDASPKTITATLINGNAEDKVNFQWSVDVYDVIDLTWNANTAIITPLREGEATITIFHPKSDFRQYVKVKVSEHTDFGFSSSTRTLQKGKSSFVSMRVPASSVKTHVEYTSDSPKVAAVQGTSAVCQITALEEGTTTIRATLRATNTNAIQAEAEMLVSVEKGSDSLVYISSNQSIITMEKGTNKTLSATLTGSGVIPTDQYNLQWKKVDDTNVVAIRGASTTGIATGQNVYITAEEAGEATIMVSHEKSNTSYVFYIIVPGDDEKEITLSKSYVTIEKGVTTEISASINEGSNDDYKSITWSASQLNDEDIVRIMGNGKTVSVLGLSVGTVTLRAQLPNGSEALCDVEVAATKYLTMDVSTTRVAPLETRTVKYKVSPSDTHIQWMRNTDEYIEDIVDNGIIDGEGSINISGIKEGNTTLTGVTSYGNKVSLQITTSWDYAFNVIGSTKISGTPDKEYSLNFSVNPKNADIYVDDTDVANLSIINNGDGTGSIKIVPQKEGTASVTVRASNPNDSDAKIGEKAIGLNFIYDKLTIVPKILLQSGSFSRIENDSEGSSIVYLGDGETFDLDFEVKEKNADYSIEEVIFHKIDITDNIEVLAGQKSSSRTFKHHDDLTRDVYRIDTWYEPSGYGLSSYYWHTGVSDIAGKDDIPWYKMTPSYSGKTHIPEKDGTELSIAYYESVAWYWRPYAWQNDYDWGENYDAYSWNAEQTGYQPAEKTVTSSDTIIKIERGRIDVVLNRNGSKETVSFPIYVEIRECLFNREP